jgi:parvulin-like peptidyl-prolyl isomerase
MLVNRFLPFCALYVLFFPWILQAQSPVAVKIDEDAISVAEVRQELGVALKNRPISEQERPVLEAQTLGLLINRYLVVKYMDRNHLGASAEDVNLSIEEFKKQLAQQNKTLDQHLKTLGFTEAELKRLFAWEIGWPSYLTKKLTAENLDKYFRAYKRNFDGTKLVVRHILLKVENTADPVAVQAAAQKLLQLKTDIEAGKVTFVDAAKQHSQGATAAQGGDLGEIERYKPMPASFNDAAYDLTVGKISNPVMTNFGVHLIFCEKEIPGTATLKDAEVEKAVREELIRYLFNVMAERERKDKKIVFTGAMPYLHPETRALVVPNAPATPANPLTPIPAPMPTTGATPAAVAPTTPAPAATAPMPIAPSPTVPAPANK